MLIDRSKFSIVTTCCWLSLFAATATLANGFAAQQSQQRHHAVKDEANHQNDVAAGGFESTRIFNPRMDYNNEWRPVGRGDPLQNDPTYDYSPPALERVRYWADSADKSAKPEDAAGDTKTTASTKNADLLLLGLAQERPRPAAPNALQNAKGELPLLQPKYSSIRRSYYAQQLPTHLMPPPMQALAMAPHSSLMKPAPGEYRQSMAAGYTASSGGTSSSMPAKQLFNKAHYSTIATSPWMHTQSQGQPHPQTYAHSASPAATPTTTTTLMKYSSGHGMPMSAFDSQQQESAHYLSYTRPNMAHTSEPYSPNSIRPSHNTFKTGSIAPRKPWVHELLKKELIKPLRPTTSSTKYLLSPATRPNYESGSNRNVAISTTFAPVNFVTAAAAVNQSTSAHTSSPIYVTSTTLPTTNVVSSTTTTTPNKSPMYSATRLLIPETSNMAFRPTVAPMEMTTDSLFAHYNQPEKPLMGPMYLIIEGHSKVKTYGKNELDPHQPKIVPIIPKREPIVRVADPNELRGGVATYQVKHLHTKKAPSTTTTTGPRTTRITTKAITKPKTTTTPKTTAKPTTTTEASLKPMTTMTATATTTKAQTIIKSTTIPTAAAATSLPKSTEKVALIDQPPTGMQGLLSLLDDSLSSIFRAEPADSQPEQRPQIDARIATKGGTIAAEDEFVDGEQREDEERRAVAVTPPRGVRQIFDYDQLPEESRLTQRLEGASKRYNFNYEDDDDAAELQAWTKEESVEYEDSAGEDIKRSDKVMDYDEDRTEKGQQHEEKDDYEDDELNETIFEDVKGAENAELGRSGREA